MKKTFILAISLTIVLITASGLSAQERSIRGKVTTFDSIPVIGATVEVKSSKQVVTSDTLGLFTVSCLPKDKVKVSARGFTNQQAKIGEEVKRLFVNLKLKPGIVNREQAINYGHVADKEQLYAVATINVNSIDFSRYEDIYDIIRSRFPGAEINADNDIIIRGTQSFVASNAALLVVNGVIVNKYTFSSIPTADIASVNVLKGNAASEYGSRGANGVVIVETKGSRGE